MKRLTLLPTLAMAALAMLFAGSFALAQNAPQDLNISFGYLQDGGSYNAYDVILTWDGNNDGNTIDGYRVYYMDFTFGDEDDSGYDFQELATTEDESLVIDASDLDVAGKSYLFYVVAYSGDDESTPSNYVSGVQGRPYNDGDVRSLYIEEMIVVTSDPGTDMDLGDVYNYDVNVRYDKVTRKDFDVKYELVKSPEGMTIDNQTGMIEWKPETSGDYYVEVRTYVDGEDVSGGQSWNLSVNKALGVEETTAQQSTLAFPNPAESNMNISFDSDVSGKLKVRVFDMNGNVVDNFSYTATTGANRFDYDAGSLLAGKYMMQINGAGFSSTVPLVIVK